MTEYDNYKYSDLICIEMCVFNIDLNVFTVTADFICSGILFQIGVLSDWGSPTTQTLFCIMFISYKGVGTSWHSHKYTSV